MYQFVLIVFGILLDVIPIGVASKVSKWEGTCDSIIGNEVLFSDLAPPGCLIPEQIVAKFVEW